MDFGSTRAGFFGAGRITLGAHFGGVVGDPQSARGPLLKTKSMVCSDFESFSSSVESFRLGVRC